MQSDSLTSLQYPSMTKLSTILASASSPSTSSDQTEGTVTLDDCQESAKPQVPSTSTVTKSNSIFGSRSFWGLKDNLLSGLSSRLEAFQSSFSDNGMTPDPSKSYNSNSCIGSTTGSPLPGKRRRPKIRSIFGQPEMVSIPIVQSSMQRSKDTSMDSLDTLDSGQSMGGSSCVSVAELRNLELHDTLRPYRTGESIGIGSGQETSLESSEAEDETNNDRLRLQLSRRPRGVDLCLNNLHSTSHQQSTTDHLTVDKSLVQSWTSTSDYHSDGPDEDEEIKKFMETFVDKIFTDSSSITLPEKATFGAYARTVKGRSLFSRYINEKRVYHKQVTESTFYSLVQHFAIILFECSESDDFSPAKTILNMCFTFYHEPTACVNSLKHQNTVQRKSSSTGTRQYLYQYLKEQPIWRSHRFWSAAFFDSVICEKAKSPIHERILSRNITQHERDEEAQLQENIVFGQLGAFTYYMKEFGLSEKFCSEFLDKQVAIGNLSKDQTFTLRQNVASLYLSQ